jgi:O-antigen/teichoic acid export membrane protein
MSQPAGPLRKQVLNSLAWSLGGLGTLQVLRFGFNLVLTRLLLPEVFGLMALVDLFIIGLSMFSDLGVGLAVIRGERGDDDRFLNTAWSLQVVRGFVIWVGLCALAWPAAVCYHTPQLLYYLPVTGLTVLGQGFSSTAVFTCERRLAQGRLVLLRVGCYLVSTAVILACLLLTDLSVWALILGRLAGCVLETAGSHWWLHGAPCRFAWDPAAAAEIFHFGKWIFVSTGCTFLGSQGDRLIVAGMTSLATLGVYNLAVGLAAVGWMVVETIATKVVYPYYSRLNQQGESFQTSFRKVHPWAAGFAAFATAGLVSTGPAVVRCLFKPDYAAAGWMLQLAALGGWVSMLEMLSGKILWVQGHTRIQAVGMGLKLLAVGPCAWAGYSLAGLGGMIVGFAAAELVRYAVTVLALRDQGLPILRYDLGFTAGIALTWAAATHAGWHFARADERVVRVVVEVSTVVVFWLGLAAVARWRFPTLARQGC